MNDKALVSILIPVYNVEKYIKKCAVSLFNQTYKNLEFVFVDDCTPDNSIEILNNVLEDYPQRKHQTKIIHHDINKGAAVTRNTCLDNASGEYIMFVDSDDWIDKDTIAECVAFGEIEKSDVIVFNSVQVYKNYTTNSFFYHYATKEEYLNDVIKRKCFVNIWGKLYHHTLFDNYNLRFIPNINNGEDYILLPQIIYYASKIVFFDKVFYHYNKMNESSFANSYKIEYANQVLAGVKILEKFFQNKDEDIYLESLRYAKLVILSGIIQRAFTNKNLYLQRHYYCSLLDGKKIIKEIKFYDRIILFLGKKKCYVILSCLCKIRKIVASIVKG